jgi:putative two-component system response regulator
MMFQAPVPNEPNSHWTDHIATSLPSGWFPRLGCDLLPNQTLSHIPRPSGESHVASRLLIVDDDEWIRDLLEKLLVRCHYRVSTARSAEAAIDLLKTEPFDLVLTDMMMVGMDGLELTRYISHTYPDLGIILITGCNEMERMRDAMRFGAIDYISKPFDISSIPMTIERNLERQQILRDAAEAKQQRSIQDTVSALITAIEKKEPHTAKHSHRVAHICLCIAEEMQLPENECRHLALAALVHDVGKIGTPDHILRKPDKLTEEEWAAMKNHPVEGAEIVSRVSELAYVADIVRHHHERVDGGGYPDGLRGNDIPLLSRVIAVADSYEVMTTNRIYRSALPRETAVARLQEGAGRQFDPEIVEVFLRIEPESLLLS